jgi:hypothetical protein
MELYRRVAGTASDGALAARALLRLGNCHVKLARMEDARRTYRRVIDEFHSQQDVVKLAKLSLLAVGPGELEAREWVDRLNAQVKQLGGALEKLDSGAARLAQDLRGDGKLPAGALQLIDEAADEETRRSMRRYLSSRYFAAALQEYNALDYDTALEHLRLAGSLQPDDEVVRDYTGRTRFILGFLPGRAPAAAPEDPPEQLFKELARAYERAASSARDGDLRGAIEEIEGALERARWLDESFVSRDAERLIEKAESLALASLARLYPAESRILQALREEKEQLARRLKGRLREMFPAQFGEPGPERDILEKARQLHGAGRSLEAKEFLLSRLGQTDEAPETRALLAQIEQVLCAGGKGLHEQAPFTVMAAAAVLPREDLDALKIPFAAVRPQEAPFVWCIVNQERGREILSAAALVGREAVGRFPDINVAPAGKSSGFLGSSMDYVSGFRKRPGGEYEPVSDVVFHGIKLSLGAARKGEAVTLEAEITVSLVVGEPQVVTTEAGQIEAPRVHQVALRHSCELLAGQYLVVGPFPNTLIPGAADRNEENMYILLSPGPAAKPSDPGAQKTGE